MRRVGGLSGSGIIKRCCTNAQRIIGHRPGPAARVAELLHGSGSGRAVQASNLTANTVRLKAACHSNIYTIGFFKNGGLASAYYRPSDPWVHLLLKDMYANRNA